MIGKVFLSLLAASLSFGSVWAVPQGGTLTNADIPRDNQKGRYLNFERAQLTPMCFSADGTKLYALHSAGARLVVFAVPQFQKLMEIPVGIGAVSLARRPGTEELWVVDSLASSVMVVKPNSANIIRTIRVGGQPHGIAFTSSGDRAYVTCSAVDRVDVISSASYAVAQSIAIPAREPRGIVWDNGKAWVVSFLSGNNTAPAGTLSDPNRVIAVRKVSGAGLNPLPDRDLLAIQTSATIGQDTLDSAATRTGLGTTLFSVSKRPGTSQLWIPNTEALNDIKGERNFVGGQVVRNRITVVDTSGAQPPVILDLDALAPADRKCAQPTHVAFSPDGTRAFVSGFGSDSIVVFDIGAGPSLSWRGAWDMPPKQPYPRGSGPRQVLLSPDGAQLYSYNRIDDSLGQIALASMPGEVPFAAEAPTPQGMGFVGVTDEERLGRHLFANAKFSKSQTSSCAACHIDGHSDGLAWDLSNFLDPEGTPASQLSYGLDVKGPLVTQSTRRMQDTGPYHWRGEKHSMNDFQSAFPNLLENQQGGQAAEIGPDFQYLLHYLNRLMYPPNPRAQLDRQYTPEELAGANLFLTKPVLGSMTCASCHTLPLGTRGEVVPEIVQGVMRTIDVPAMRGVADKLSAVHLIGGEFGRRTELGAGLSHGGAMADLGDAIRRNNPQTGLPTFNLSPQEVTQITAFLKAFDSGLAPSAGYAATAHSGNAASFAADQLAWLKLEAERGNCDLVFYRSPRVLHGGGVLLLTGRYDPLTQTWRSAARTAQPVSEALLMAEASANRPVTFLGLPVGMGLTHGLDRDCDGMWDLDEWRKGCNPEDEDTDSDGYPDGYEMNWNMNPLVADGSSPDMVPPSLDAPARLVLATSNTIKFEFQASEMCKAYISYNGGYIVQRLPLGPPSWDDFHQVTLEGLEPGTSYAITLELRDPAGHTSIDSTTNFQTLPLLFGTPTRVAGIQLQLVPAEANQLQALVNLKTGSAGAGSGYVVKGSLYRVLFGGGLSLLANNALGLTNAVGQASFNITLPPATPGQPSTLIFVVSDVAVPIGAPAWVLSEDEVSNAAIGY